MEAFLNKITQGDCLELIKQIPDNTVDFLLTDPPYFSNLEVDYSHEKKVSSTGRQISRLERNIKSGVNKIVAINSDIKMSDWFDEAMRVLKSPIMLIWMDERTQLLDTLKCVEKYDLKYYLICWHKSNSVPLAQIYMRDKEVALYIFKKTDKNYLPDYEHRKTIIKNNTNNATAKNNSADFVTWHPTPKPLKMIEMFIEKHTQKGEEVLDIFSGSGTTCVAAKRTGRNFIGFELNEEYVKKSRERLETDGSQGMFDF